ncbi:hypothetical protein DFH08DRAFT_1080216, partial [Mycena albidolilacea]
MAASASSRPDSAAEQLSQATLKMYRDRPELDPRQGLAEFAQCRGTDDIMLALEKRINTLKDFRDDHWAKICKQLKPVVQVLLRVADTAGESAESIGIPGGKGVFAAVGLLLAATQAQSARYDTLEKLLEQLNTVLSCFNVLCEKTFSHPHPALDQIATTILAHLFYILALSTKFLRKPRGHYLYSLIGFSDDLKEALQKLDNFQEKMKVIVFTSTCTLVGAEELLPLAKPFDDNIADTRENLQNIYIISGGVGGSGGNSDQVGGTGGTGEGPRIYVNSQQSPELNNNIEHIRKDLQNIQSVQVDNKFKEWLLGDQFRTADPATDRNAALKKRQEGTGNWLLQNRDFKNWRCFKRKSVLWLHGGSGTGKTILSAYVVNELLCSIPDLAYFFFRVKAKEDLEGMLSSTLLQLASGQERHKILRDAYNSDGRKGPPSRSSLLTYFKRMLTVPHHLVLIIDALDEHPKPRDELLRFLTELIQSHNHIHLFIASRDEPDICACLQNIGAVEVDLNMELNQKDDLCKYITGVLQLDEPFREWEHSHPDIINLIKHRLLKESMFRLVALQLDQLRDSAPIDVKATLETLPHSLVEMYEYILQSLESKHPKTAQRVMHVFELISCTSRSLSADEAAEVFAVQFNSDNSVQVLEEYRLQNPTRELVEKCTSAFIRIEKSTIQFAHASVLEYLRNPGVSRATPRLDPASAKITLSKLCLCTIHSVIQPSTPQRQTGPFDNYAREFWLQATAHALSHKSHSPEIKGLLDSILLGGIDSIPTRRLWHKETTLTPLQCASYLGLYDYILQVLIMHSTSINQANEDGVTALHLALEQGHLDIVQLLIKHGASVDQANKNGLTALHLALWAGHLDVVWLLIEHSTAVNKANKDGLTALHLASRRGHCDIVQLLI